MLGLIGAGNLTAIGDGDLYIRRASGFELVGGAPAWSPLSLPNLRVWLDASDTSTVTKSGDNITLWTDKSGNGNNGTPSTGTVTHGVNTINSLPVIRFNGTVNSRLELPVDAIRSEVGRCHMLLVFKPNSVPGPQSAIMGWGSGSGGSNARIRGFWQEDSGIRVVQWYVDGFVGGSLNTTNAFLGELVSNDSFTKAFLNEGEVSSATQSGAGQLSGFFWLGVDRYIGGYQPWNGQIAELIATSEPLTGSDLTDVRTYLADKWGITL
jgi:hypothetical protein